MTGETPDVGLGEAIAEALMEHEGSRVDPGTDVWRCTCGEVMRWPSRKVHREHVAVVLLAVVEAAHARDLAALRERAEVAEAKVAAAWDEAVQALAWAMDNGPDPLRYVAEHNPYRAALDPPPGRSGTANPGARA